MSQDLWTAVDHFLAAAVLPPDSALEAALAANARAGMPAIDVSPLQGRLLQLIARIQGAINVLEIGTLGGYSTICIARALPSDGRLVTLELDPGHAEVARANIAAAGLEKIVEIRVGRALELLPKLKAEKRAPFDLVFIDADKAGNPDYFNWALELTRPGSVIIVDNVVRKGSVLEADSSDAAVQGTRRLHAILGTESRVTATVIQTVGTKGHDGFAIARVN